MLGEWAYKLCNIPKMDSNFRLLKSAEDYLDETSIRTKGHRHNGGKGREVPSWRDGHPQGEHLFKFEMVLDISRRWPFPPQNKPIAQSASRLFWRFNSAFAHFLFNWRFAKVGKGNGKKNVENSGKRRGTRIWWRKEENNERRGHQMVKLKIGMGNN